MRDERTPRRRLMVLLAGVLLWAGVVVARLIDVQIYRADELQRLAVRQQFSRIKTEPVRGAILDRNGFPLAISKDVSSLYAAPGLVEAPKETSTRLARILGVPATQLRKRLDKSDRNFVWLGRKLSDEQTTAVAALGIAGLGFRTESKRYYPGGPIAAHILGYTGLDNSGLAGLELEFDQLIRGVPGDEITMRDARGVHFMPEPGGLPAIPGDNLVLTINRTLQHIVERELKATVSQFVAKAGVAVMVDPNTGDILAMAAEPTFDPNEFARASEATRRNPAVQEAYEPGSTFKAITFAAALEKGSLSLGEHIDCGRGSIEIAGVRMHDHKSFDILTPLEILTHSSNVGAIRIGQRVAPDDFYRHMRRFGFGGTTGVQLPGEAPGLLATPRSWSKLTRAAVSIGQEIAVTPLQLVMAYAAIANGGTLRVPRIVARLESPAGATTRIWPIKDGRTVVTPETARKLVTMMMNVVKEGTAKQAAIPDITVAGKTGTAQKIVNGTYSRDKHVASFAGFAPAQNPRVVLLVAIDEPRGAVYHGGEVAAPIVRRILEPTLVVLHHPSSTRVVELTIRDHYPDTSADIDRPPTLAIAERR